MIITTFTKILQTQNSAFNKLTKTYIAPRFTKADAIRKPKNESASLIKSEKFAVFD